MKLKKGSKSGLKYFSYQDIVSWKPCYDPIKYIPKTWKGTAIDILNLKDVSFSDTFWVVLRPEIISDKVKRLFAVWCARQVQHLMADPRSIKAIDVAEAYANGLATKEELEEAYTASAHAAFSTPASAFSAASASATASSPFSVATAAAYASYAAPGISRKQKEKLIEMIKAEGRERLINKRSKK